MSESTPSKFSPHEAAMFHLIGLRYAMAGDTESAEALDTLMNRVGTIDWRDPVFIKFSEDMRVGMPSSDQETFNEPILRAILHAQGELISQEIEDAAIRRETLKRQIEQLKQAIEAQAALLASYKKMRARLEMLGVDVAEFQVPGDF